MLIFTGELLYTAPLHCKDEGYYGFRHPKARSSRTHISALFLTAAKRMVKKTVADR
jgi:hypothetical protein